MKSRAKSFRHSSRYRAARLPLAKICPLCRFNAKAVLFRRCQRPATSPALVCVHHPPGLWPFQVGQLDSPLGEQFVRAQQDVLSVDRGRKLPKLTFSSHRRLCQTRPAELPSSQVLQASRNPINVGEATSSAVRKPVLLTAGSSSGMGFEVAKCLSQKNATVIIAARNKQKCEK